MSAALNADDDRAVRTAWGYAAFICVTSFLALCAVFSEESVGAYRVWVGNETYQHCFLILPITLYMIWRRREALFSILPKPEFRALVLLLPLSLAWSAASLLSILEAQQFIALSILQVMFLSVLGWPVYRKLMAPFLYLYFLVPTGAFLIPALQDFTARFAVLGLQLVGVPVFSDGIIIEVPAGTFVVAEACAGLRFLIASVAFGVFYATEMYHGTWRRLIFMGLSVVVPIIANGFRAFGLVLIAQIYGNAAAVEADHLTFGWVFFSIVLIALIFLGSAFSDRDRKSISEAPKMLPRSAFPQRRALALSGVLSVGLAALSPLFFIFLDRASALVVVPERPPTVSLPWQIVDNAMPNWRPVVIGADAEFLREFSDGEEAIYQFLALYGGSRSSDNLIRSDNRIADVDVWRFASRTDGDVNLHGAATVPINVDEIVFGRRRLLVWSYYVVDGENAARLLNVKARQLRAYLGGSACPNAMVAVGVEIKGDIARAEKALQGFLSSVEPLGPYLCGQN